MPNSAKQVFLILLSVLLFSSCSMFQRMGVGAASGMFYEASGEMETESNFENFKVALAGQLKMLEGLLSLKPEDAALRITLAKGYAAYAFAVNETAYLADFYAEKDQSLHKKQAIYNYSRALEHGLAWLKSEGVHYQDLQKASTEQKGIVKILDDALGDDQLELEGVVFTAQALAGLINFQKDNMTLVSQLSIAKGMYDYACSLKPDIANGVCQLFYAAYEAGRPRMLGGNPEKGKELFLKAIETSPHNWLARVAYMQFYLIPQADEDGYKTQKFYMEKYSRLAEEEMRWNPASKVKSDPAFKTKKIRFYQALAVERYNIIKKYEKDLF